MNEKQANYLIHQDQKNQEAYETSEKIIAIRDNIEKGFLILAKLLYNFNKKRYYKTLGYPSLKAYCSDPDVDINVRTAFRLIDVYETFVIKLDIADENLLTAGTTKLSMISPYANDENKYNLVWQAMSLSKKDLIKYMAETIPEYDPPPLTTHINSARVIIMNIDPSQDDKVFDVMDLSLTLRENFFEMKGTVDVQEIQDETLPDEISGGPSTSQPESEK